MLKTRTVFSIVLAGIVSIACSTEAPTGQASSLSFTFPTQNQINSGGNQALAGFSCFALNINAEDIEGTTPTSCDPEYGLMSNLIGAGGSVELEATQGSARTIELYYVVSPNPCDSMDMSQGIAQVFGANNVHRLGSTTVDFDSAVVEVDLPIEMPKSTNTLAVLDTKPATCNKTVAPTPKPLTLTEARVVIGAGREVLGNGHTAVVRVTDQKIDISNPTTFNYRVKPARLGEER